MTPKIIEITVGPKNSRDLPPVPSLCEPDDPRLVLITQALVRHIVREQFRAHDERAKKKRAEGEDRRAV